MLDNTGYTGPVDMDISGDTLDTTALNSNFEKYGLKLVEKIQVMPVVVLTKTK